MTSTKKPAIWMSFILGAFACSAEGPAADPGGRANGSQDGNGGGNVGSDEGGGDVFGGTGGSSDDDNTCAEVDAAAETKILPVDIILAIDQSGSMDLETTWVEQQLNSFASQITSASVDVRVVVIASKSGDNNICVPAPLGSGNCPDDDNPPHLLHVDQFVGSHSAFFHILGTYDQYKSFLRPDSWKHFVVITDDDAKGTGHEEFSTTLPTLDPPGMFTNWTFHAIAAKTDCYYAADDGKHYKKLAELTGGVFGDICQQDFQPVWDELSTQIVQESTLACAYELPDPPAGESFDATKVNLELSIDEQASVTIGKVSTADDCTDENGGWHYDNEDNPTQIVMCPSTCDAVESASSASMSIKLGCTSIDAQ